MDKISKMKLKYCDFPIGLEGYIEVGVIRCSDLAVTYETSGNISYSPAVVDPDLTKNETSRLLYNRLVIEGIHKQLLLITIFLKIP